MLKIRNENEHILYFREMSDDFEFIIANVYCQYSVPLERFLSQLENLVNSLPMEKELNQCKCQIRIVLI